MKKTLILATLCATLQAYGKTWVAEMKRPLHKAEVERLAKSIGGSAELFMPNHKDSYFARLIVVSGDEALLRANPLVAKIEDSFALHTYALIPSPRAERVVNDNLFPYQWALYNQDQTLVKDIDDIRGLRVKGIAGEDLGWKAARALTNLKDKYRPLVAVVDTGVDLKHPELIHALEKNKVECESTDPAVDADNNGFPGDCDGWNFTAPLQSELGRNPQDRVGHGTHLSGIIAAAQNGKGVVGVSPDIRILPVKVIEDGVTEGEGQRLSMSDRLARGIIYAVDRGADIINLSLGWPRSLETDYLRRAVGYALTKKVVLVAAAGNNNSSEPIFPCAIDGVVCVGATSIDGSWAGFSNFGSTVDVLAPGEGILSTNPIQLEPEIFNVPGYEIKSGTSQAAPYVAAALAVLKGNKKELNSDQLIAALYASTRPAPQGEKYAINGGLDLTKLLSHDRLPSLVRPQFKLLRQLMYKLGEENKTFQLPVKNFGQMESEVTVKVESLSDAIEIINPDNNLGVMAAGVQRPLNVRYRLADLDAHSQIRLKFTISESGVVRSYLTEIPLVRDIRDDQHVQTKMFKFLERVLPVGAVRDGSVYANIATIDELFPSGKPEYFMRRVITEPREGEEKGLELVVFRDSDGNVTQLDKPIFIKDATQLVSIARMDVNYDGKEEYAIQAIVETKNGETTDRYIRFNFLDKDLKPALGDASEWIYRPEGAVATSDALRFAGQELANFGKVACPVFIATGRLPKADQDPSPWVAPDMSSRERLYYLVPEWVNGKVELKTHSLTTQGFIRETIARFNMEWDERVDLVGFLHQDKATYNSGKVDVLYSLGRGVFRKIYRVGLTSEEPTWTLFAPENVRLEAMIRRDLFDLKEENNFYNAGDAFVEFYDAVTARLVTYEGVEPKPAANLIVRHDSKSDSMLGHLGSYREQSGNSHFLQSKSRLILVQERAGEQKRFTRPILRFSFLPGRLLSELYYPIYVGADQSKKPALYVDSTQITTNRIYVLTSGEDGLTAPARHSIFVPANCRALNPGMTSDLHTFQYNMLCAEETGWAMKTLVLE